VVKTCLFSESLYVVLNLQLYIEENMFSVENGSADEVENSNTMPASKDA
jgi:hypothetical protein